MKNLNDWKLVLLVFALTSLSACSSSQVEETEVAPAETAGEVNPEAVTDAVPGLDPSLDPNLQQSPDALAADPSLDVPVTDAPLADAPITENVVVDAPAVEGEPVADAPLVETPVMETPVENSMVAAAPAVEEAAPAVVSDGTEYRVKKGDTLMKIAFEQYGDLYRWKEIYEANRSNIKDPNHVPPGTQLVLNGAGMVTIERNGESYLIKRGDTLGLISNDDYGTTRKWKKLWENNRQLIKDPNKIYAGFYLYYVPEGKLTHEDVAPALKKEDSAMNAPTVSTAPREPASATLTAPEGAVPAPSKN